MNSLATENNNDYEKNISGDNLLDRKYNRQEDQSIILNGYTFARMFIFTLSIAALILNSYTGFALPNTNVDCLLDKSFEFTAGINKYLHDNITSRHLLIAISSLCVDFVILFLGIYWCLYGKSWRLITVLFCFYSIRAVIQNIFQMKYPDGYLWEYPGFPSITVSYLKTNDFFFSGHVGFPIILALESQKLDKKYLMVFCIFTSFFEAFTMIVTRGHYIIDIITGVAMAHYFYMVVDKYLNFMDYYFPMDKTTRDNNEYSEFKPVLITN